jgi:hypothetical protein
MQKKMSATLDCTSAPFVTGIKNCNQVLTVAPLGERYANKAMVVSVVGSGAYVWRESGVTWSILCYCVCHEDVITFNLLFEEILQIAHPEEK